MGLTATLPPEEEYISLLETYAPPVFEYTLEDGVKDKVIAPFKVYNLPVTLTRKERAIYNVHDGNFKRAQGMMASWNKLNGRLFYSIFDVAKEYKDVPTHEMYK